VIEELRQSGLSIDLTDSLPMIVGSTSSQLWKSGRGCQLPQMIRLQNSGLRQRPDVNDAGSPHLLQPISVDSTPPNARLRKLAVHNSSLSTPRGHSQISAKSDVVTDLLMREHMSKRRHRVQLRQFLCHLTMRDDNVCPTLAESRPQATDRLPLRMSVHIGGVVSRKQ
jgi:hypothetical protein